MQENGRQSPENITPGILIGDRYRLLKLLGKGTFGQVFSAEDAKFQPPRVVAIKILHPQFINEPGVREDIRREAGVLARFQHPDILRVIDFEVNENIAYIVTDLAQGGSLSGKIRPDPTQPPVRMPLEQVAFYLDQIADALDEAHSKGLVHRDIKPLNILLDARERPLVADFGLTAALSSSQSSVLVEADPSGTPLYMAPEQYLGQAGKASDIYALGIVAFQLITGYPPFNGNKLELMGQHINKPIPPLAAVAPGLVYPPALDRVMAAVLDKDPLRRTHPAREFARQFRAALAGTLENTQPATTIPSYPFPQPVAPARKASPVLAIGIVLALLVVAAVVTVVLLSNPSNSGKADQVSAPTNTLPPVTSTNTAIPATQQILAGFTLPPVTSVIVPTRTPVSPTRVATSTPAPPTPTSAPSAWWQSSEKMFTLVGHRGGIWAVAVSPDGKLIASGDTSGELKLWDAASLKLIGTYNDKQGTINWLAFSPDGKILAAANYQKTITLWSTDSGAKVLTRLSGHTEQVAGIAFSPDGKFLASGSEDLNIKIWDLADYKETTTLSGHAKGVISVAFTPDGQTLVSGGQDNSVRVWDLKTQSNTVTIRSVSMQMHKMALSPDGKLIATANFEGTVGLYDRETGKLVATLENNHHVYQTVVFSADSKTVGAGSWDNNIALWDVSSHRPLNLLEGHDDRVLALTFSQDGKFLVSAGYDNTVRVWKNS